MPQDGLSQFTVAGWTGTFLDSDETLDMLVEGTIVLEKGKNRWA